MKGQLIPIEVPWMISPSVPNLVLTVEENGDANITAYVEVLPEGHQLDDELSDKRVIIYFKSGQWIRTYPALSDADTIPPDLFDTSKKYPFYYPDNIERYLIESRAIWVATQHCPTPRFYRVDNSQWLEESGAKRYNCIHYVIQGHDFWIEILALSSSWEWIGDEK